MTDADLMAEALLLVALREGRASAAVWYASSLEITLALHRLRELGLIRLRPGAVDVGGPRLEAWELTPGGAMTVQGALDSLRREARS